MSMLITHSGNNCHLKQQNINGYPCRANKKLCRNDYALDQIALKIAHNPILLGVRTSAPSIIEIEHINVNGANISIAT